jgi:hypothetical protein
MHFTDDVNDEDDLNSDYSEDYEANEEEDIEVQEMEMEQEMAQKVEQEHMDIDEDWDAENENALKSLLEDPDYINGNSRAGSDNNFTDLSRFAGALDR